MPIALRLGIDGYRFAPPILRRTDAPCELFRSAVKVRSQIRRSAAARYRSAQEDVGYRFFHPPRCPGAPPLDRGAGPNSGPDSRELVGWMILLPLPAEAGAPPRFAP